MVNLCTDPNCEFNALPCNGHSHSAVGVVFTEPVDVRLFEMGDDGRVHIVKEFPSDPATHLTPSVVYQP